MNWAKWADRLFPYIESLSAEEKQAQEKSLKVDVAAIGSAKFGTDEQRALDEAQRVAAAEMERVRTSEAKATTYLAVLAALVPLVITLQGATWEDKSGPAPGWLKLGMLAIATVYVAAAGYHAFRTLRVTGFQRIGEREITAAWRSPRPLQKLARSTLLASRRSRDAVNLKVTYIKVTHEHLLRAFGAFVLLLLLDPVFYAMGFHNELARLDANSSVIRVPVTTPREEPRTPAQGSTRSPTVPKTQLSRQQDEAILSPSSPDPASKMESSPTAEKSTPAIHQPAE